MSLRRILVTIAALAFLASACAADETAANQSAAGSETGAIAGATRPLVLTDPGDTPAVDRSIASVALSDVVFDTFVYGGAIPLSEADANTVVRLFDAIRPIDAPVYESGDTVDWLPPDDLVVGFVDPEGSAWAYPVRILNSREIVNDELGGLPVVITYCPLCGSGVVYGRDLGERTLSFSNTSALHENDMVMVDRETGTYWWQVAGEGIVGTLTGETLPLLASQTTTFERWLEQYPETWVMERQGGRLPSDSFADYDETLDAGRTPFPVSGGVLDDGRLAPSARVILVELNGERRAWATEPARVVEDELGGEPITVTLDGVGGVVVAGDGSLVPLRSAFWFSVVSVDPSIQLGSS